MLHNKASICVGYEAYGGNATAAVAMLTQPSPGTGFEMGSRVVPKAPIIRWQQVPQRPSLAPCGKPRPAPGRRGRGNATCVEQGSASRSHDGGFHGFEDLCLPGGRGRHRGDPASRDAASGAPSPWQGSVRIEGAAAERPHPWRGAAAKGLRHVRRGLPPLVPLRLHLPAEQGAAGLPLDAAAPAGTGRSAPVPGAVAETVRGSERANPPKPHGRAA